MEPQALTVPPAAEAASFHMTVLAVPVASTVVVMLPSAIGTGNVEGHGSM
jgi:hypothetical protein